MLKYDLNSSLARIGGVRGRVSLLMVQVVFVGGIIFFISHSYIWKEFRDSWLFLYFYKLSSYIKDYLLTSVIFLILILFPHYLLISVIRTRQKNEKKKY